jgi:hypothetical protein
MELRSAVPLKTNPHAAAPSAVANDGVSGFGFDIFQGDARGYAFERRRLDQALVKSVERGHVRDDNAQSIVGVACQAIKLHDLTHRRDFCGEACKTLSVTVCHLDRNKNGHSQSKFSWIKQCNAAFDYTRRIESLKPSPAQATLYTGQTGHSL